MINELGTSESGHCGSKQNSGGLPFLIRGKQVEPAPAEKKSLAFGGEQKSESRRVSVERNANFVRRAAMTQFSRRFVRLNAFLGLGSSLHSPRAFLFAGQTQPVTKKKPAGMEPVPALTPFVDASHPL